jgi:hypothetical protein
LDKVDNQLIIYEKGKDTINSDCYRLITNYYPKKEDLISIDEEKIKREKLEVERIEQERLAAAEKQRQEQERIAAEKQRQEQERIAAEKQRQEPALLTRRQIRVAKIKNNNIVPLNEQPVSDVINQGKLEEAIKLSEEKNNNNMAAALAKLEEFKRNINAPAAGAGGTRKKRKNKTLKKRNRSKRHINN